MINVRPVSALKDNYIWMLHDLGHARTIIVDPGESRPVLEALSRYDLEPAAILVTHHHWDHVGGITELVDRYAVPVYAPAAEVIPGCTQGVRDGDTIAVEGTSITFRALAVPGHTLGAIAYFGEGMVLSGDTLFTAGCGRLFEGTAAQMHQSLCRLAALPQDTLLYCGHEYTLANLRFAAAVEPDNTAIGKRARETQDRYAGGLPAVPASLATERQTNPFLRCDTDTVRHSAERYSGRSLPTAVEVFAAIREWKDRF